MLELHAFLDIGVAKYRHILSYSPQPTPGGRTKNYNCLKVQRVRAWSAILQFASCRWEFICSLKPAIHLAATLSVLGCV
jgi:hypothetical protein